MNLEIESTVTVQITYDEFEAFECDIEETSLIFGCGTRVRDCVETKETKLYKHVLKFNGSRLVPVTRAVALEQLAPLNFDIGSLAEVQHIKRKWVDRNRISVIHNIGSNRCVWTIETEYNKEETGVSVINGEYEASFNCNLPYVHREMTMIDLVDRDIKPNIPNFINILDCIPVKLQLHYTFKEHMDYMYMPKWDGYKAKAVFYEDRLVLIGDLKDIITLPISKEISEKVKPITNYILQVEVMESLNWLIFVDIIGGIFEDELFYTEVCDLKHTLNILKCVEDITLGNWTLQAQIIKTGALPTHVQKYRDGVIIIQNNTLIKWKMPTFDAECIDGHRFAVPSVDIVFDPMVTGEIGQIYEFGYDGEKIVLIRSRHDRACASSKDEYAAYSLAVNIINNK